MTGAGLLGLLLLEHALIAHVIDFGYSSSRRGGYRFWYISLVLYCLADILGSLFILNDYPLTLVTVALLVEFAGLATTSVLEREAPLNRLLVRHALCESIMVGVYCAMVYILVS